MDKIFNETILQTETLFAETGDIAAKKCFFEPSYDIIAGGDKPLTLKGSMRVEPSGVCHFRSYRHSTQNMRNLLHDFCFAKLFSTKKTLQLHAKWNLDTDPQRIMDDMYELYRAMGYLFDNQSHAA